MDNERRGRERNQKKPCGVVENVENGLIVDTDILTNNVRHFNTIKHLKVISGK